MVGPLPPHQARGDPAQLVVDQRDEFTPGPLVAGPGPSQDERKSLRLPGSHDASDDKTMKGSLRHFSQDSSGGQGAEDRRRTDFVDLTSRNNPPLGKGDTRLFGKASARAI